MAAHRAKVVGDSVLGTSVLPQPAEIERLIRAGDLEAAENALEELLRATPKNSEALVQLGLLYAALRNQPERAIPFFRKAIEANPEHEAALDRLLVSTTRTRGIGDSEKTLRDLHSLFPDSSNLNGEMGRMLMSQGRTTEAVAHFERATAKRPSPDNQLDLADALAAAGQSERAREIAQRILKRDPGNGAAIDLLTSLRQDSRPN